MVAGQTVWADSPEKREIRKWAEESMAQGQRRGCPCRALGIGCFLAEEAPFKLRLGQFLEECWWGAQKQEEQGGSGKFITAQELGERTGGLVSI